MITSLRPYIRLVSDNTDFRRLWLSQIVSNFGDWFGLLAVYALVTRFSDSEFLLGLVIIIKTLSLAVSSPLAGYITDRFNRRHLMIGCDLLRFVVVLGFLLIRSGGLLWLAYLLLMLQMFLSAIFLPARSSSIPNVTSSEELVTANILSSLSWSMIFTMGMALGGIATEFLGTDLVFIMDAASYLLSAYFIYGAVIPQHQETDTNGTAVHRQPLQGIMEGFLYLRRHATIRRPALAKGTFEIFQGALVYMLILVAERKLLMGSLGLGLLYASRGLGTGVGPIVARRWFRDENYWITLIGFLMMFSGGMYFFVGIWGSLIPIMIFVFFAHTASGANWVMSTVLLQRRTPDPIRGRVFSLEWVYLTLAQSGSVALASLLLDNQWVTLDTAILLFAILLASTGIGWLSTIVKRENKDKAEELREMNLN